MAVADVLSIAQQYLNGVSRTGNENIMAFCPFHHNTNTPAFSMSLTSGLWICFSCKRTGNLATFLHDVGVPGSVVQGRYKYAIEDAAKYRAPRFDPLHPRCAGIDPLPESLLGLFDMCPNSLLEEGFDQDVLQDFGVGYDETHHRITYPLRDLQGAFLGISGRTVIDAHPRYKVYDIEYEKWGLPRRETKKGLILWNAHRIYKEVFNRTDVAVVLVEGFKACMWVAQAGVSHVVALMGSFMSDHQRWLLERMGATVYVMMDNDAAGQVALHGHPATSEHPEFPGIAKKLSKSLEVKIVQYNPEKKQPSDLSQNEVVAALNSAKDYHLWTIEGTANGIR